MEEINLGQITSLMYCAECGCPNEIYPNQEKIKCKACGKENDLKITFALDVSKDSNTKGVNKKNDKENYRTIFKKESANEVI